MSDTVDLLLVEDDPADLALIRHALQRHQFTSTIHVARDGAEALEFVFRNGRYADRSEQRPYVILLDLKLPLIDGIEVLRRIKTDPSTQSIPTIVLTSSREDRDVRNCYQLGANSYIVKPVEFAQFDEVVNQIGSYWLIYNQYPPR